MTMNMLRHLPPPPVIRGRGSRATYIVFWSIDVNKFENKNILQKWNRNGQIIRDRQNR